MRSSSATAAIAATAAPGAVLYQSVPDLTADPGNFSYCSQCFSGGYYSGQQFTLASGAKLGTLSFVTRGMAGLWPTAVTVDFFRDNGALLGSNVYDHTFSTFVSDMPTAYHTRVVTVDLGGLQLAAGTYDLMLWSPEYFALPAFPAARGGQIDEHVGSARGPATGDAYWFTWQSGDRGSNAGIQLNGAVSVAPEPAIWGLMLAGFGLIGCAMRSRREAAVA